MIKFLFLLLLSFNLFSHPFTPCDVTTGLSDVYPCEKIDLLHLVEVQEMGGDSNNSGSDIWGWTDDSTGKEYALMTLNTGTRFVDISDPKFPIYLGKLDTAASNSSWRDIKTYANHAFIVSEASGHGMQIFDLTLLRNISNPPVNFSATANYTEFGNAHNIVINEDTGFAYAVGTNTCSGGLHMINIQNPTAPINAGCFSADGYSHDAQCVLYTLGPDTQHSNKEICFNSNEDTLTIVDVTDKNNPIQLSRASYNGSQYTHQGWLTDDQRYYLMNDELDEQNAGHNTKTYLWDLVDLDNPQLIGFYSGPKASIDHNLYIKGNYAYLSNYTSGLRIVDISDIGNANLTEVASFDIYPANDNAVFSGAWSNYPYFDSGTVIMSDYSSAGLFVLGPKLCPPIASAQGLAAQANGDNTIDLNWDLNLNTGETYTVYRSEGGCSTENFVAIANQLSSNFYSDTSVTGLAPVGYKISKVGAEGQCESERSLCVETQTTGSCTIPPNFSGIASATSTNTATCGITLQWLQASSYCGNSVSYDIYKSSNPTFSPSDSNKIASAITQNNYLDIAVSNGLEYYYLVRATDTGNGNQENNNLKLSATAVGVIGNGTWNNSAELGDTGFSQVGKHVGWEFNTTTVHTGNRSYWSTNQSNLCNDLVTETITLTAGQNSQLSFWTAYDIESQWDGGVVEITNDNNLWQQNPLTPDYPDSFNANSSNACNYPQATPSFTGRNLNWQQYSMDLSSYQGQDIRIRWNYSTDGNTNNGGWFLDDFSITNTQIPSQCTTIIIDNIFANGFD